MGKLLKNFLAFFLSAAILVASSGVVIASHICLSSQKSDVSLFEHHGCCSEAGSDCKPVPPASGQLKKNCCQLSISYFKIDIPSVQKTFSLKADFIAPAEQTVFSGFSFGEWNVYQTNFTGPGLKSGGIDFLHRIHLLLI
jgi:hypothetical protein